MKATLKPLIRTTHFQVALTFCILTGIILGFYYGSQTVLGTNVPYAFVSTESRHISNDNSSSGWSHPFQQTLQIGDLRVVQGTNPNFLNTNYPNSDIIVFYNPENPSKTTTHRIMTTTEIDNKQYFFTNWDGTTNYQWSTPVNSVYYDQWLNRSADVWSGAISEDLVIDKVVMRLPWIGFVPLIIQNSLENRGLYNVGIIEPIAVLLMTPAFFEFSIMD